jgi:hypothetical protein
MEGRGIEGLTLTYKRSDGLYLGRYMGTEKDVILLRGINLKIFITVNISEHMNCLVLHSKPALNF